MMPDWALGMPNLPGIEELAGREDTEQEFRPVMRFVLCVLLFVCVGGFLVTSGILPIISVGDAAKARSLALAHSLPVLVAVAAPRRWSSAGSGCSRLVSARVGLRWAVSRA